MYVYKICEKDIAQNLWKINNFLLFIIEYECPQNLKSKLYAQRKMDFESRLSYQLSGVPNQMANKNLTRVAMTFKGIVIKTLFFSIRYDNNNERNIFSM